jgi:glyoxylase-like metal-dependent hydrolase (beta-lactamase superfamily II)
VDTGWADSAPVIARAIDLLGRRTSDVERIVLSHFHDDHVGSAATVAQWSGSTVAAGRADTPFIRGVEEGPWPTLTAAEQALNRPMPGTVALPPPCRVDHEAATEMCSISPAAPWCCTSGATPRAASRCICHV